jgi:hypothetical protein
MYKRTLSALAFALMMATCGVHVAEGEEPAPSLAPLDYASGIGLKRPLEPFLAAASRRGQPSEELKPWVHHAMPPSIKRKLESAFELAVQRVTEKPECREMYTRLGKDGIELLRSTLYFVANPYKETTLCRRASAFTHVGERPTWMCREFSSLSDSRAAAVLLHEALHHGGLPERPADPKAMGTVAVTRMISRRCGF